MLGFSCSNTGMLCRISFKARGRKIDWSSAKRLMFGSLLCLSCDNFKTLLWAVVANRTAENLALEMVDLQLLEHSEQMSLDSNEVYVMAESSAAYFEAYLHVLKALQLPDLDELPFQEHFVALEPQVKEPIYLKQRNRKDVYDFETVFPNIRDELRTAQFHILEGWPAWENSLDASQLSALKHGLTKQLALIQGPPGTGKTFVGLLLVRVLINNLKSTLPKSEQFLSPCQSAADMEDTADGPILVVCYTNHALDQFLEGIYEHEEEIVRVGGRSKSPVLEGCSLQKLLLGERSWYNEELQSMNRKLHEQKQVLQREIEDCISLLNAEYVTKHALLDIASREQVKSLFYEQCDIINVVEVWFNERDRDTRIGHIQERYSQKQTEILSTQNPYEILQTESFQDVRQQIRNYDDFMSNNRSDGALKQHASNATSECSSSVSAEMDVHDEAEGTDVSERSGDEEIERSSKYSNCQGIGLPSGDMFEKSTSLYGVGSVDTLKVLESLGQDETQQMDLGRLQLLSAVPDESWTEVPKKKRGKHISLPTELQHVGTTTNKGDQEIDVNDLDMLKKHNDVWTLTRKARRVLHAHWLDVIRKDTREKLKKLHSDYDETCKRKQEVENEIKLCLMRKAKIVGMTTTAAARYHSVLACLKAQIVVIEEAAEVLESHILACITESTKHLIMIGDHLQLRPSVATYELALKHGLDVSLFERLVKGGVEYVTLEVQRRMRPSISTLISSIYPMLRDHESVSNRDKIRGMKSDVFFMHHTNPEEQRGEDDSGKLNVVEAQLIVELCAYLIKQQYSYDDITILSMYNGQVMEIKSRMARKLPQNVDSHPKLPRVSSVDDYQGEECKIIILSLVRNNCLPAPGSPGKIGFLSVSNRVCVSLSRARDGLFIFGNGDLLMKKSKLWEDVVKNLEGSNSYGDALILVCPNHPDKEVKVKNPEDFRHVPDGGCDQPCEYQLSCGHVCPKYCHPGGHDKVVCPKRCPRKHAACNHDCQAPCHGFEACPPCRVLIEKVLPQCGHSARISCSASIESVICSAPCPRLLECSHPCRRNCGMSCTTSCPQPVEKLLSCGHLVKIACHIDPSEYLCIEPCRQKLPDCMHTCEGTCGKCKQGQDHIPCLNKCNRTLPCGHRCSSSCHRVCPPCSMPCQKRCLHSRCPQICGYPCVPCMETCAWRCEHHACHLLCHKICKRPVCNVPCRKLLRCGHPCLGFCGEPCPFICRMCTPQYKDTISLMTMEDFDETDRFVVLPDCGHVFEVSGLDTWMQSDQSDSGTSSISPKSCPTCRIIIRQSARYGNRVKAGMQQLEEVKMRILGFHEVNEGISLLKTKKFDKALEKFSTALKTNRLNYEACLGLGSTLCFQFKYSESLPFFHRVVKHSSLRCYASELETSDTSTKWKTLEQHKLEALLETIDSDPLPAVVKAEKPLAIRALVQWGNALSKMGKFSAATRACEIVLKEDPGNKDAQNMLVLVKEGKQTQADVVAVLMKEVGGKGHWYKCPNGHYYVVGECGGPMQLSKCPDCQETVGGQNHKSAAGNTHSSIDGSSHSAWSDRTGFGGFPVL
ncbi:hypothetical protein KP509_04G085400 [Ceratopteris richardii]|uniref:NFX1-type zinc finger-containing protein 1 n=1 Tax=Ceratopteris richardii TaxID=49495 RepID=A0A8T2V1A3_CERRI|nr:hypothetical protein KP509_04G085400 [Ceratopteris richardii]